MNDHLVGDFKDSRIPPSHSDDLLYSGIRLTDAPFFFPSYSDTRKLAFYLIILYLLIIELAMAPTDQRKFVELLHKQAALLLLLPGLASGALVVKEAEIADLQLAHLEAEAELVEDITLPLECRRKVKICELKTFIL